MNKSDVLALIIEKLQQDLAVLQKAVKTAHETATHEESVAEDKYDTFGLEAAYLAHGQAVRAQEIENAIAVYQRIKLDTLDGHQQIKLSSLVTLENEEGEQSLVWVGQEAGGVKVTYNGTEISIVTPSSPLGQFMIGQEEGDVFEVKINDQVAEYEVISVQ